jgi:hypothetical protein
MCKHTENKQNQRVAYDGTHAANPLATQCLRLGAACGPAATVAKACRNSVCYGPP